MISLPVISTLEPYVCEQFRLFPSKITDLIRLDMMFEAGSAYQPQPLCASAAGKLCTIATKRMEASLMAEYMDFRGIIVETSTDVLQSTLTLYMLRRYIGEVLPIVSDILRKPLFGADDFSVWKAKRKQEIFANEQRSLVQARRLFYEALFGPNHPLGRYANADDVDRLELENVKKFYIQRHSIPTCVVLSGNVDDDVVELMKMNNIFSIKRTDSLASLVTFKTCMTHNRCHYPMANSVQTTLRIGRILPLRWNDADYAMLMIAVSILGGYFGSRLMSNLRENKGYTYGIYARTQIYRGVIVFYITTDVSGGKVDDSINEVIRELRLLCDEPVSQKELELVITVMTADFLRSVDGVFERAARYLDIVGTDIDERFTDNLRNALQSVTPTDIHRVSRKYLAPENMIVCTAGA